MAPQTQAMKSEINLLHPKALYTNEEEILGIIKLDPSIGRVRLSLALSCEASLSIDGDMKIQYYEKRISIEPSSHKNDSAPFRIRLPDAGAALPGSFSWYSDDVFPSRIVWSLQVFALGQLIAEKQIAFVPTRPRPDLFAIDEVEETRDIGKEKLTVIASHAAAGLPQFPLNAGLGLKIHAATGGLELTQLRVCLVESIVISTRTGQSQTRTERLLLLNCEPKLTLEPGSTSLDRYVRDIRIEPFLTESFATDHFVHSFALRFTLVFGTVRFILLTPVEVLGRIPAEKRVEDTPALQNLAYVTDSDSEPEDEDEGAIEEGSPEYDLSAQLQRRKSSASKPRVSISSSVYVVEV